MKILYALPILFFTLSTSIRAQDYCTFDVVTQISADDDGWERVSSLLTQDDGWMIGIASTYYSSPGYHEVGLIRFDINRNLDPDFGNNGAITHLWSNSNTATCGDLQADGKILLGGYQSEFAGQSGLRGYVSRLNTDGSADLTFGTAGNVQLPFSTDAAHTTNVKAMDDGTTQVIVQSRFPRGLYMFQLTETGELDTNFRSVGYSFHPVTDMAHWIDSGDAIFTPDSGVIALSFVNGTNNSAYPLLYKFDKYGDPDTLFNDTGSLIIDELMNISNDISAYLDEEGDLYITADPYVVSNGYVVYKVNSTNGAADQSFGIDGRVESIEQTPTHLSRGLIIEPATGDLLVYGTGGSPLSYSKIWRCDAETGAEITDCDSPAEMWALPIQNTQGFATAAVADNATVQFIAEGNSDFLLPHSSIPSSVPDLDELQFSVYPNPAHDLLTIDGLDYGQYRFNIIDPRGAIVLQGSYSDPIDLTTLATGPYWISVLSEEGKMGVHSILIE